MLCGACSVILERLGSSEGGGSDEMPPVEQLGYLFIAQEPGVADVFVMAHRCII